MLAKARADPAAERQSADRPDADARAVVDTPNDDAAARPQRVAYSAWRSAAAHAEVRAAPRAEQHRIPASSSRTAVLASQNHIAALHTSSQRMSSFVARARQVQGAMLAAVRGALRQPQHNAWGVSPALRAQHAMGHCPAHRAMDTAQWHAPPSGLPPSVAKQPRGHNIARRRDHGLRQPTPRTS